jgi:hypothetical protein
MLQLRHIFFLVSSKALDVVITYYGIVNKIAYEINPLWTCVNENPILMLSGFSIISFLAVLTYLVQPILIRKSKNDQERNFCIKTIDWTFYIVIILNISVVGYNTIQLIASRVFL